MEVVMIGLLIGASIGIAILIVVDHFRKTYKKVKIDIGILESEVYGLKMLSDTYKKSWQKLWHEHPELFNKNPKVKSRYSRYVLFKRYDSSHRWGFRFKS